MGGPDSTWGGGIALDRSGSSTIERNIIDSGGNIVADPYFCDLAGGIFTLAEDSPALSHPAGPLGAFPLPGCGPVSMERITWGRIKTLYK